MNTAYFWLDGLVVQSSANPDAAIFRTLQESLALAKQKLQGFANDPEFTENMAVAFGKGAKFDTLKTRWSEGDFSAFPAIEIRSGVEINGANGAFGANKIYLSLEFLTSHQGDIGAITGVILEEFGHWVDTQVNTVDSDGDEGAIFAALVQGSLSDQELQLLKAEDDRTVIILDGQSIAIEQQNFTGTAGDDTIIATGNLLVSNGSINSGDGTDTLITDYSSASFIYLGNAGYGVTNIYADSFEGLWHRLAGWGVQTLLTYNNVEVFQITGTQYADSLRGYSGNDTLIGGEGNDDIAGGDGNDLIKGGDGNDILKGEGGNDEIEGGEGNDTIDGGTGRQVIRAGIGDDTVVSAKAGDSIDGGEGNDTLQNLDLTSLDVNLVLDLRVTEQVSGDSNTHINNIENISSVNLGSGSDTIIATGNLLVSNGSINSGDGTDTLITDYSSASFIYLGNAGYGVTNIYADSFEGLWHRLAGWGVQTLLTYNNVEVFQITGTQYADSLRGYSGNDTLIGGEGNDDIAGGDGNDLIISVNPDVAKPGLGTVDTVTGGAGRDTFVLGDATWIGYDDCNSTTVGTSDYLIIKDFNPQDDIIQLWGSSSDYTITVSDNNINLYINKPDSEPDELIAVLENTQGLINPSQFRLNGSYFKYVITNVVTNQSPTDIVLTNPTTAIAENTSTTTRIKVADIAITDDALGTNNLSVSGTDASFFEIDGNVLYLKANTALNFEAKTSYSVNVNVDDSTVGSTTDATTNFTLTVTDINEAPVRNSAIASQAVNNGSAFNYFFGSNTFADPEGTALTYSISGQPSWLTFNSNTRTFGGIANGVGASTITVSASDGVNVTTTNFSLIVNQPVVTTTVLNQSAATSGQTIIGTTSVDSIFGSVFNDLIRAGNGEDTINGNGGNDRLYGEGGNDIIVGGFGTDNLYGGLGSDTFVIQAAGNGLDVVNDFQDGIDFIGLSATNSGGLTFASLTFTAFGTGGVSTSIRAGATEIMRLINVAPSLISNADFQSIG